MPPTRDISCLSLSVPELFPYGIREQHKYQPIILSLGSWYNLDIEILKPVISYSPGYCPHGNGTTYCFITELSYKTLFHKEEFCLI